MVDPAGLPRFAGRLGAGRGRTPAVGHPGSDARGHRGLEDRPRVGIGHLLHLPRTLHGVADRRAEHHVPPDQNRARKRKTVNDYGYPNTLATLLVADYLPAGGTARIPALRTGWAGAALRHRQDRRGT